MSKIYEPQGRAREYSPLALNYYQGCTHKCAYCYVPRINERFGRHYEECKPNLDLKALEASAKKYQGCEKQILLSFTGDPYCGVEPETTTRVLEVLKKYNHKVAILTKGGKRVLRDLDLIKSFGDRIKIGATLTFYDTDVSRKWESGAADPKERIEVLRTLHEEGVKTWVSFEPVIIPTDSLKLLKEVSTFVDSVKIGKINNYQGLDKTIDWGRFIFEAVRICRDSNLPFYIKKDLQKYNRGVYLSGNETNEDFLNL